MSDPTTQNPSSSSSSCSSSSNTSVQSGSQSSSNRSATVGSDVNNLVRYTVWLLGNEKLKRDCCQPSLTFVNFKLIQRQLALEEAKKQKVDFVFALKDSKLLICQAKKRACSQCSKSTSSDEYDFANIRLREQLKIPSSVGGGTTAGQNDKLVIVWLNRPVKPQSPSYNLVYYAVECKTPEDAINLLKCLGDARRRGFLLQGREDNDEDEDGPFQVEAIQLGEGSIKPRSDQVDISSLVKPHLTESGIRKHQSVQLTFLKDQLKIVKLGSGSACKKPSSKSIAYTKVKRVEIGQREEASGDIGGSGGSDQLTTTIVAIYVATSKNKQSYAVFEFDEYRQACRSYDIISQAIGNPPSYRGLLECGIHQQQTQPDEQEGHAQEIPTIVPEPVEIGVEPESCQPIQAAPPPRPRPVPVIKTTITTRTDDKKAVDTSMTTGRIKCPVAPVDGKSSNNQDRWWTSIEDLKTEMGDDIIFLDDQKRISTSGSVFMYARQFSPTKKETVKVTKELELAKEKVEKSSSSSSSSESD